MRDALVGFIAAVLTSIPMLGPVVLLLFSAGVHSNDRRGALLAARSLALGAALAEGVHVALAVFGVAPFLLSLPEIAVWLRVLAGLALIALALLAWRVRARPRSLTPNGPLSAFALGAALVLMNPGFLVTWVAVLAFASSRAGTHDWGPAFVAGAVLGVLAWFFTVLELARRLGPRLESRLSAVRALVATGLGLLGTWLVIAAALE